MAAIMNGEAQGPHHPEDDRLGTRSRPVDRYPNRTHFIEIENPEHDRMATRTLLRKDPVVLIYPARSELLIDPDPSGGARIETRDCSGKPSRLSLNGHSGRPALRYRRHFGV